MKNSTRLEAWFKGELSDDELTKKEVRWLQKQVFRAVAEKMLFRDDVHSFAEHKTLQ